MKLYQQIQSDNTSNLLLYGTFMFTNIDYNGIVDYLIKAVLGAIVWFGFKLLQDYYSAKLRAKENAVLKDTENKQNEKP
ncbi:MAG TPA: hypothetical protein VLB84_17260 [Bacteroidia bacterium]|nr:hypothetical protein [Bacteroidia bacterium]